MKQWARIYIVIGWGFQPFSYILALPVRDIRTTTGAYDIHTIWCTLTQGTRMIVYDLVNWANLFEAHDLYTIWCPLTHGLGVRISTILKIFRNYLVQVVQNHPGAHNLHSIWYPMTQEHIWFRGQNPNRFEIICHFQLWRRGWPRGPDLIYLFYCPSQTI